jgi:hypothetical protein
VLSFPGSFFTNPLGIHRGNIVGFDQLADFPAPRHGFVFDVAAWTTLDYPGSIATEAHGIDANNIVGAWADGDRSHGFLYDGTSWLSFDYPDSVATIASDISGKRIVGLYFDETGNGHSFVATVPEPGTVGQIGVALTMIVLFRFKVWRSSGTQPFS